MKYRSKQKVIEAMQLTIRNHDEVKQWSGGFNWRDGHDKILLGLKIKTLEGTLCACFGDYVIKGIKNEFYPVREDIFLETYEAVE